MAQTESKRRNCVWITGASSGLGRSLAFAMANNNWLVFASARNENALTEMASRNDRIIPVPCDITDVESVQRVVGQISDNCAILDRVILNAGNCEYLDFPNPDWQAVRRVMEINYFGTVNCVEAVLPLLRRSPDSQSHLVVIASQVTAAPFPRAEAYGASKAALQYFCDSLRIDLMPENIDVSVVNPGFVDTPLTRKNDFDMPFLMGADEAAARIVKHLDTRPDQYSFPWRLRAVLSLSKVFPGYWRKSVSGSANPKTRSLEGVEK